MWTLLHKFISGKADGTDSTRVRPSAWNDEHDFKVSQACVLGSQTGAGDVAEIPMANLPLAFPGAVVMCANPAAPAGWLLCDGAVISAATYPALYAAIGNTYNIGGEATGTFRVPDLRGRVVAGMDLMSGSTEANANRISGYLPSTTLGGVGGAQSLQYAVNGSSGTAFTNGLGGTAFTNGLGTNIGNNQTGQSQSAGGNEYSGSGHSHIVQGNVGISVSGNAGVTNNGTTTDTRGILQPTMVMNMVIKT